MDDFVEDSLRRRNRHNNTARSVDHGQNRRYNRRDEQVRSQTPREPSDLNSTRISRIPETRSSVGEVNSPRDSINSKIEQLDEELDRMRIGSHENSIFAEDQETHASTRNPRSRSMHRPASTSSNTLLKNYTDSLDSNEQLRKELNSAQEKVTQAKKEANEEKAAREKAQLKESRQKELIEKQEEMINKLKKGLKSKATAYKVVDLENQALEENLDNLYRQTEEYERKLEEKELELDDQLAQLRQGRQDSVQMEAEYRGLLFSMTTIAKEFKENTKLLVDLLAEVYGDYKARHENLEVYSKRKLDEIKSTLDSLKGIHNGPEVNKYMELLAQVNDGFSQYQNLNYKIYLEYLDKKRQLDQINQDYDKSQYKVKIYHEAIDKAHPIVFIFYYLVGIISFLFIQMLVRWLN